MAFDGSVRYEGAVKSFNPEKGWGHIECPEIFEQYGKDVFLLKSQLVGASVVSKGHFVRFSLTDNGRGPEACNIEVLGAGGPAPMAAAAATMAAAPPAATSPGAYVGTIKSFNPTSGWGHISCPQTQAIFGKDMFFMKSSVPGGNIAKGTTVQFSVSQGAKGPEATQIRPMGGAPMMPAAMPQMRSATPMRNTVGSLGAMGGVPGVTGAVPGAVMAGQHYYGTIKSFNDEKGWGHITCPQTQAVYGKDIFVMRSALNGAPVAANDQVQFQVAMGQKGPEAANVRVIGASTEQQLFAGTVKQWNEEKGFGFIACEETRALYQKDIFIHKKETNGHTPVQGEPVQFSVQISAQGRPEGSNLVFTNDAAAATYGAWKATATAGARPGPF